MEASECFWLSIAESKASIVYFLSIGNYLWCHKSNSFRLTSSLPSEIHLSIRALYETACTSATQLICWWKIRILYFRGSQKVGWLEAFTEVTYPITSNLILVAERTSSSSPLSAHHNLSFSKNVSASGITFALKEKEWDFIESLLYREAVSDPHEFLETAKFYDSLCADQEDCRREWHA